MIFFLFKFVHKSLKSVFYVSAVNCYCTCVFKGSKYVVFFQNIIQEQLFSAKFLNICSPGPSPLMDWPIWIVKLWKWTSILTEVAWVGECRLARFHVIRNFLTNEIYHFSRLFHCCFLTRHTALYNQLLIRPLLLVSECYLA